MEKTETVPSSETKSALQEFIARRITDERPTAPRRRRTDEKPVTPAGVEQDVSRPAHVVGNDYGALTSGVVLEPVSRLPYELSYSSLLIPRFSAHYLIGDIAEDLRDWMQQICISFEWRLDDISVRPEYMQWVLFVPANTPPSRCIRTIREQTSKRIFEDFPHIRKENLSKDFWAPGYLVLVGPTPHPPEMINEYIRLTRQQQGIQPHLRG